jgi:hypothetical protein
VRHRASPKFWQFYNTLPSEIQKLADENYQLLKQDSSHPSLHFKKVGKFWSVRVGIHHRALAVEEGADVVWFWIGRHDEYERLIGKRR